VNAVAQFNPGDLAYLVPYLILCVGGLLLVLAEAFFHGKDRSALAGLAVAASLASAVASVILYMQTPAGAAQRVLGDMLIADREAYVLSALFALITALTAMMTPAHQREHGWQIGEYYGVMLLSASGMVILAHASNLVTVFLGIETMSIGVYVMTAMRRTSRRGNEAAMKYFLIGAFATAFFVYGMAMLYGASGTLSLIAMKGKLATTVNPGLVIAGGFLLIVAFGFKVAAVPFHMWAPDAYEGAPTPVTGFMAAGVKAAGHFTAVNEGVLQDPRVKLVVGDGRNAVQFAKEPYDVIISQPSNLWISGMSTLFTREFFAMASQRLTPGGVFCQWIQAYRMPLDDFRSLLRTFFEVFPHGSIWVNNIDGRGYDLVLLGQAEPTRIDLDELANRLASPEYETIAKSLRDINFNSVSDLFATFAGQAQDFRPWLKDARINTDRNLRLQYLAGFGLNLYQANDIYKHMVAYGPRMPKNMFTGSSESLASLARLIESGRFR